MTIENGSSAVDSVVPSLPLWQWAVRIVVVVVELILAYCCSAEGELFFYQGF